MVEKVVAAICYLLGVYLVISVAIGYYGGQYPSQGDTDFFLANWYLYVLGMALVAVAAILWPKRDSGNGGSNE